MNDWHFQIFILIVRLQDHIRFFFSQQLQTAYEFASFFFPFWMNLQLLNSILIQPTFSVPIGGFSHPGKMNI